MVMSTPAGRFSFFNSSTVFAVGSMISISRLCVRCSKVSCDFLSECGERNTVKRSMPKDKPGSLGTGAYVDVVAYLLQANKFPAGTTELSRVPERLEPIVIERSKTP